MTRDEALKIASDEKYQMTPLGWVDQLVALGVLKLDEPVRPICYAGRIDKAIEDMGWTGAVAPVVRFAGLNIEQAIRHAGLKIVEA